MKTVLKIILVPVVIGLIFTIGSGFLWCIGKLLLLVNFNLLPGGCDCTFSEIVMIGGWHLLALILVLMILGLVYGLVSSLVNSFFN